MPDLPPARIRFSHGSGWEDAIVRAVTWSDIAHLGFLLPDGMVIDATPAHGVALRQPDPENELFVFDVVVPAPVIEAAVAYARTQISRPYDWSAVIGVGLHRDWRRPDSWDCSELVAAAFEQAGFPLLRADHLNRITPRDLLMSPLLRPVA